MRPLCSSLNVAGICSVFYIYFEYAATEAYSKHIPKHAAYYEEMWGFQENTPCNTGCVLFA